MYNRWLNNICIIIYYIINFKYYKQQYWSNKIVYDNNYLLYMDVSTPVIICEQIT